MFRSDNTKGLVFYFHGNAGSLLRWGSMAPNYTALNCNISILEYRDYGKSEGNINNEAQLLDDNHGFMTSLRKDTMKKISSLYDAPRVPD